MEFLVGLCIVFPSILKFVDQENLFTYMYYNISYPKLIYLLNNIYGENTLFKNFYRMFNKWVIYCKEPKLFFRLLHQYDVDYKRINNTSLDVVDFILDNWEYWYSLPVSKQHLTILYITDRKDLTDRQFNKLISLYFDYSVNEDIAVVDYYKRNMRNLIRNCLPKDFKNKFDFLEEMT